MQVPRVPGLNGVATCPTQLGVDDGFNLHFRFTILLPLHLEPGEIAYPAPRIPTRAFPSINTGCPYLLLALPALKTSTLLPSSNNPPLYLLTYCFQQSGNRPPFGS